MKETLDQNKRTVTRFNKEFVEQESINSFKELISDDVINHTAPAGQQNGPDSMFYFLNNILKKGFPDLKLEIFDQIAEGDKVVTRKAFHATHSGEFMGIAPTNKKVTINIIDIIRLQNGQYAEHWGMSNLSEVIAEISK